MTIHRIHLTINVLDRKKPHFTTKQIEETVRKKLNIMKSKDGLRIWVESFDGGVSVFDREAE
jgi:hypothetical protein